MWSPFPLRLCMAAMAPALTDAAAHTGSFKLPASPANPGNSGLQASPNQPTSPDLPSLTNGHSPAVPDQEIGKRYNRKAHTLLELENEDRPALPSCYTIHTHFLDNNNHKQRAADCRIEDIKCSNLPSNRINGHDKGNLKNKLNSLISTIGSGLLVANGEGHSNIQGIQKTMSNSVVSLAQKDDLSNIHSSVTTATSKMPPLTISATAGISSEAGTKHSIAAASIHGANIRTNGDVIELDTSDTSCSVMSNDVDSSLSVSCTALTTDTSMEQIEEPEKNKNDGKEFIEGSVLQHSTIPSGVKDVRGKSKTDGTDRHETNVKPVEQVKRVDHVRKQPKMIFQVVNENIPGEAKIDGTILEHKRLKLEHRAKYMTEKIRRLQTCQTGAHVYQQIGSFVESKQSYHDSVGAATSANNSCEECRRNRLQSSNRAGSFSRSNLTHSHTCSLHSSNSERQRHCARPSWLPAGKRTKPSTHISQHLRDGKQSYREVKSVTGRLLASLGHVENTVDSDVTDSSSGGESCDEGDDSLPHTQSTRSFHKMPLHRRASWKWAIDRAAIASRWTWLQAQVSDLEYRIRQQSDIFRQIRATKGSVTLGEPPSPEEYLRAQSLIARTGRKLTPLETKIVMLEGPNSMSPTNLTTLLSNVDKQSAKLKQSLQNCISPISGPLSSITSESKTSPARPLNGITENMKTPSTPSTVCGTNTTSSPNYMEMIGLDQLAGPSISVEEQYCARTRPVKQFRKRKLIRSTGLYQVCRKAQKLSAVRCGCFPPRTPCVMCGGRFNNVEQFDADQLPTDERMASLDYSFHSVLSFPEEISLTMHFESLVKSGAWQRKHAARSIGRKKLNRLPSRSRVKARGKDNRLKKFRKKDKHHRQRQQTVHEVGDATRKREDFMKKELKERQYHMGDDFDRDEGSANEDNDAARSRKLLHRLARQKLKVIRQVGSNKFLSRSRSQPSSVPGTPKNPLKSSDMRQCRTEIKKRRAAELAIAALNKSRERSMSLPNIEVGDSPLSTPTTPASIEARSPTQQLSHSLPSNSLQSILRHKKGIVESYDIDNIVIPYSMLASTRVERLQYKEIVTPKWREVDPDEMTNTNNHVHAENDEDVEDFEENLSDSEFLHRHSSCESVEKQKFLVSIVDHGIPGRRSRRSRNSSVGSVADPQSPDMNLDQLSPGMQSSASPSPSPITTDQWINSASSGIFNLSGNRSMRFSALNRRRCSSMSDTQSVKQSDDPSVLKIWIPRQFPLNTSEMEEVNAYPESEPSTRPSSRASNATHPESITSRTESQEVNFYISEPENSEPEPMEVDDPNDPEWTVVEDQPKPRKIEGSSLSESLVLKLAKR